MSRCNNPEFDMVYGLDVLYASKVIDENGKVVNIADFLREPLRKFAIAMEQKLRKNDHKKGWRDQPIEALYKLLKIEMAEFEVADEFLTVAESRRELLDVSNFALMLHDRLGMILQDKNRHQQNAE